VQDTAIPRSFEITRRAHPPGRQREFLGLIDVLREELPAQLAGYQQER